MAASAAKQRAERKLERQAEALEKHQRKIESELNNLPLCLTVASPQMKKIEEITERLHRQQRREADRLRHRLHYAASRIQSTFRAYSNRQRLQREAAATRLQCLWRGAMARTRLSLLRQRRDASRADHAARVVTKSLRVFACRALRRHEWAWRSYGATTIQCAVRQWLARRQLQCLRTLDAERQRQHRAATKLQAQARMFLTRVVYLDVLFLVCRMQAVVRGFLVRKRLRWLLSINLRAVVRFQAIVRGALVRQRHQRQAAANLTDDEPESSTSLHRKAPMRRSTKMQSRPPVSQAQKQLTIAPAPARSQPVRTQSLVRSALSSALELSPVAHSPKRNYWLPAGASAAAHRVQTHSAAAPSPASPPRSVAYRWHGEPRHRVAVS
ncbi:hypothetical protein PINS_up001922 [Pythium insidiosum]|nr:hypothetical protein PINS_up001922 [Pythium insidiosum]